MYIFDCTPKEGPREYNTWYWMKQRCNNPNHESFRYYGGRGIRVCERWDRSFFNFFDDMGSKPKDLTLDRINNELGHFKGNCKWATQAEQLANRRPVGCCEILNALAIKEEKIYQELRVEFEEDLFKSKFASLDGMR